MGLRHARHNCRILVAVRDFVTFDNWLRLLDKHLVSRRESGSVRKWKTRSDLKFNIRVAKRLRE
jgi:hypothetical protein